MTREQIVGVLTSMQRAWNARDPQVLAGLHADDSVVHSPIFGEVRGRAEIERTYAELFRAFSDWVYEGLEIVIDGNRAAQFATVSGTHTSELFGVAATNRRFKFQCVIFFEFRDGKIVHERRIYDFTSLLLQVGVIKAKPST